MKLIYQFIQLNNLNIRNNFFIFYSKSMHNNSLYIVLAN